MSGAERTVDLLGLVVGPVRRARFAEEWRSDLADARAFGTTPASVLLAACRVALLLLVLRIRDALRRGRRRRRGRLLAAGVLVGILLAVTDVPSAVLVPVALIAVAVHARRAVAARLAPARIDAAQ